MWKQWHNDAQDCSDGRCIPILVWLQGEGSLCQSELWKNRKSQEKPYWDRDLSRPTERRGVIGCLSLQRVDVQIAGQGDPPGHWDTIEMVIAPLVCLKLQNDFPPHEYIFRSPYMLFNRRCSTQITKCNYGGYSRLTVVCGFFLCYCLTQDMTYRLIQWYPTYYRSSCWYG